MTRRKVDVQKLSAQVSRMLAGAKALKYFDYGIEADGTDTWRENAEVIDQESRFDGWYLLTTSLSPGQAAKETIFSHDRNLLEVEDAFRETKSYLEMRPIHHQRDDRVRNHIRICFLAYWISARLRYEWSGKGERREVPLVLRDLQQIKVGKPRVADTPLKAVLTDIPAATYAVLGKLNLLALFQRPPHGPCSNQCGAAVRNFAPSQGRRVMLRATQGGFWTSLRRRCDHDVTERWMDAPDPRHGLFVVGRTAGGSFRRSSDGEGVRSGERLRPARPKRQPHGFPV